MTLPPRTRAASGLIPAGDDPAPGPAIAPFWQRLNSFFLFPLQIEPLIFMTLLSLASYLLFLPLLARIFVFVALVYGATHYAFKVAALASRGILHSRDYTAAVSDADWKVLPWKFFGVLLAHGIAVVFVSRRSEALGLLVSLASSLLLPASMMVLIRSFSMRSAINPLEAMTAAADVGRQYFVLCLFLFLLQAGFPQALALLVPVAPTWLLLPLVTFAAIYFFWVMAALVGYVMYQHHDALDIDLLREPEAEAPRTAAPADPAKAEARRRDAALARLVQAGELSEAIAEAREWARTSEHLADHRRLHRALLLDDPVSGRLAEHARRFVPLLLTRGQAGEALDVFKATTRKLPDFDPGDAASTLALAQHAWKSADTGAATRLLRAFDRRFAGTPEVPLAYELTVRVLKTGFSRSEQALAVYRTLARRYPGHPAVEEAAWVLREELAAVAGG